ncbi:hypothetical protein IF1G_09952 [Cordyceps javanica]|uniref:Uncharacterized protein n=1 Tax=Cordyceps javanica TaxID=43265 RepID=A0A545UPT1_9HYPO|nr:hypothetical protein IF1G_09952 [Cordyceps javanica]
MYAHVASLTQTPLHVLGLILRELDTLHSLGSAILAHPVLHAAFAEDPARITRDILDAQMSPATARLAYAAHAARRVDRTSTAAVKKFADEWLVPLDDDKDSGAAGGGQEGGEEEEQGAGEEAGGAGGAGQEQGAGKEGAGAGAEAGGSEGGPLGVWPWGLSLPDVVSMSKAHGVVEELTAMLVDSTLPRCEGLFGARRADYAKATPAEVARIHRMLYGYDIYCGLLFRDADDCRPDLSWRTELNFQLSAALYRDNVVKANNQLACIHDFLEKIVLQAFKQVAMYDVTWGAHEVDYLSTGSANEHVQAYLSLGLDYIYKLAQANSLLGGPGPGPGAGATTTAASSRPDEQLQHFRRLRQMLLTHRYSSTSALPPRTAYMLASELNAHSRAHLAKTGAAERERACHLEVDETHRPAMKRSWARRGDMYARGYRGFYMEHL